MDIEPILLLILIWIPSFAKEQLIVPRFATKQANTKYGLRCSPRCDTVCCGNKPWQTKLKERIKIAFLRRLRMHHYGLIRDNLTVPSYQIIKPHVVVPPVPHVPTATLASSSFSNKTNHHLIQLQQTQMIHYLQSHVLLSRSLEHHLCRPLCPTIHLHRLLTGQNIGTYQHQFARLKQTQLIHPLAKVVPARNIHLQILSPNNNITREVTVAKEVEKSSI